jgi:hypothetical protein
MKIEKMDVSVAVLAGLSCFTMLIGLPVWTIFIGWAWYFALGADPSGFGKAIPPMLLGYAMAAISIVVFALSNFNIVALSISVAATVFIIMLSLKTKLFAHSLASFNTYSCMFAGYYAVSFPKVESSAMDLNNILICIGWLSLANVIGLCFGYVSVKLGTMGATS